MTEAAPPPQEAPLPPAPAEKPKTNALAIVSLICGIAAVPFAFCFAIGIVPAIAGIITGHLALKKVGTSGGTVGGRSLAIAGLVISYIAAALCIVMIIILIAATGTAVQEMEQIQEQMERDLAPTESVIE